MNDAFNRRTFLLAAASVPFFRAGSSPAAQKHDSSARARLEKIERDFGGRLGVFALSTANGASLGHRARERFPVCSTFKVLAAAAILRRSEREPRLMQRRIKFQKSQLVTYSPITEKHLAQGMTVAQLCAAAIQHSDNTAANLLLKMLGGPRALTAFARSIGDSQFRLDRWETALNTAIPGDPRDTSTPQSMGKSLQRLVVGDALAAPGREQLRLWLLGNTTGAARIRAGVPDSWKVGDKTGSGDYGTANDIAMLWPPQQKPAMVAIYTTQPEKDAKYRNDVVASAAQVVADWLQASV